MNCITYEKEYRNLITACIRRAASLHQASIIEINVQPEHVHCVVSVAFTFLALRVLQLLKGISAKLFFEYHKKARLRYPRTFMEPRKICILSWICSAWNGAELYQGTRFTLWKPHTLVCGGCHSYNGFSLLIFKNL